MKRIARLRLLWAELNAEHFAGQLKPVPIRVTRSKRTYGYFNAPDNGGQPSIRISRVLADAEPHLVRDTMTHEMIHQQLHATGFIDWHAHSRPFQREHERIFGVAYVEPT